jgi:hypothetical protein
LKRFFIKENKKEMGNMLEACMEDDNNEHDCCHKINKKYYNDNKYYKIVNINPTPLLNENTDIII